MTRVKIPINITVTPRDHAFGRTQAPARWWLNGDPVASAIFDALSSTFPQGERFFIDSLRPYRASTSPELQAQITAFIRQEALHTREHVVFNRHVESHGRDLSAMEARTTRTLAIARARPPWVQLAVTAALEHFTAILAHVILADARYLQGGDPETARLWRWHALEEIEHKGVAMDTLNHVLRKLPPLRRWLLRTSIMGHVTVRFLGTAASNVRQILREDGVDAPRVRRGLARYLFWSPGLAWSLLPRYLAFYLPGFHPWKADDRGLLARAEPDLSPA